MKNWIFFFCTLCFPFKELFFSVYSKWKSAEPVFCTEEQSCVPYKNQNKSLQFWGGKIQICCIVKSFYKAVLSLGHLWNIPFFLGHFLTRIGWKPRQLSGALQMFVFPTKESPLLTGKVELMFWSESLKLVRFWA